MSDYHILDFDNKGKVAQIVMHIATPVGDNFATKSYATCIVEDSSVGMVSLLAGISVGEATALADGALVEKVVSFKTHPNKTNTQKRAAIDALYISTKLKIQTAIQHKYWGWGYERNLP